jgi:hypothetical protein
MDKRIKELAEQADLLWSKRDGYWKAYDDSKDLERFAKLVRQDEREACAKLCDEWGDFAGIELAMQIRARGEK